MNDTMSIGDFFDHFKKVEDFKVACTTSDVASVAQLLPSIASEQVFFVLQNLPHCDPNVLNVIWEHHQGDEAFFHTLKNMALSKSVPHVLAWVVPLMPRTSETTSHLLIGAENAIHAHNLDMIDLLENLVQVPDKYSDFMGTAAYCGHVDLVLRWLNKVNMHHPYATFLSSAAENNKLDVVRVLAPLSTHSEIYKALDHSWNYDSIEITEVLFDVLKDDAVECDRALQAAKKFHKKYNASPAAIRFIELCDAQLLRATLAEEVKSSSGSISSTRKL